MCEMSDWVSDGTHAMASMLCGGVRVAGDDWDGPDNLRMNLSDGVSGKGELQGRCWGAGVAGGLGWAW